MRSQILLSSLLFALCACGTKGGLSLPPGPPTPPLLGRQPPQTRPIVPQKLPPQAVPDDSNKATTSETKQ